MTRSVHRRGRFWRIDRRSTFGSRYEESKGSDIKRTNQFRGTSIFANKSIRTTDRYANYVSSRVDPYVVFFLLAVFAGDDRSDLRAEQRRRGGLRRNTFRIFETLEQPLDNVFVRNRHAPCCNPKEWVVEMGNERKKRRNGKEGRKTERKNERKKEGTEVGR